MFPRTCDFTLAGPFEFDLHGSSLFRVHNRLKHGFFIPKKLANFFKLVPLLKVYHYGESAAFLVKAVLTRTQFVKAQNEEVNRYGEFKL